MLIFDLDGTLSDPALGIGRSLNYALAAFGHPAIDERAVSRYIGQPLDLTFRRLVPTASDAAILAMVASYRDRYGEVGYAENEVYAAIPEALRGLSTRGVRMGVCTSKPAHFAEQILVRFELREYFDFVSGGDVGVRKDGQLKALLDRGTIGRSSMMIGDREIDVAAARSVGLRSAGVLWGHGSHQELLAAAPDRLLERPDELLGLADVTQ